MPDPSVGFRPVYGEAADTQEEIEACYVCANCDEIRKDHMSDGACLFSPTQFEVMKTYHINKDHVEETCPVMRVKTRGLAGK